MIIQNFNGEGYFLIVVPLLLLFIVVGWTLFKKAGQPGWAILIPFYNLYVYTQVLRRPKWWILVYCSIGIPIAGYLAIFFVSVIDNLRLARVFGKPPVFGVGLLLIPIIFTTILAFGSAEYDAKHVVEDELL